eukprot:TRINITY_DN796_c0_g1_i4.p1 TRINITY_DN796_c0_g1~~TRINITY_DN796_c0_g1_i4.p1  ORF type:complete len:204 (+),score=61.12 TRINITY_DN796_c0_g1_i4:137-748(+)
MARDGQKREDKEKKPLLSKPAPLLYPPHPELPPKPNTGNHAFYIHKNVKMKQRLRVSPYYLSKPTVVKDIDRYTDRYHRDSNKPVKITTLFPNNGEGYFPVVLLKNVKTVTRKRKTNPAFGGLSLEEIGRKEQEEEEEKAKKEKKTETKKEKKKTGVEEDEDEENQEEVEGEMEEPDDYTNVTFDDDDDGKEDDDLGDNEPTL